jgi:hypothetical protein
MSHGGIQGDERGQNFVSNHRQRLREKISDVPDSANVLHAELASPDPVLRQMEAHVAGLGHLWLDDPVGQTYGDLIVTMNRRGGLGVPKIRKQGPLSSPQQTCLRILPLVLRSRRRGCAWSKPKSAR